LPDHARFCLQCGASILPPEEEPPSPVPVQTAPKPELDFVQPALTGGMFLGFLSSIPFISAGNCICCMWVLLGGGIAVMMLTKQRPSGIAYGDGARSEEHTSELQSRRDLVCRLLLEKKNEPHQTRALLCHVVVALLLQ